MNGKQTKALGSPEPDIPEEKNTSGSAIELVPTNPEQARTRHGDVMNHHGDDTPGGDHHDSSSSPSLTEITVRTLSPASTEPGRESQQTLEMELQTTLEPGPQAVVIGDLKSDQEPSSGAVTPPSNPKPVTLDQDGKQGQSTISLTPSEDGLSPISSIIETDKEVIQFEVSETSPFPVTLSPVTKKEDEGTRKRGWVVKTPHLAPPRPTSPHLATSSPACQCCSCACECGDQRTEEQDDEASESSLCQPFIRLFGFLPFVRVRTTSASETTPEALKQDPPEERVTEVNLVIRSRGPSEEAAQPVQVSLQVTTSPGAECEVTRVTGAGPGLTVEEGVVTNNLQLQKLGELPDDDKSDAFSIKGMLSKLSFVRNIFVVPDSDQSAGQNSITPTEAVSVDKTPEDGPAAPLPGISFQEPVDDPDVFERPSPEFVDQSVMTESENTKKRGIKQKVKRALNVKRSAKKLRDRYKSNDSLWSKDSNKSGRTKSK